MGSCAKVVVFGKGLIGSALSRVMCADSARFTVSVLARESVDLKDTDAVSAILRIERPDYIVCAAGRVAGIEENLRRPVAMMVENLALQTSVMMAARDAGVRRMLFFASSCMYPRDANQPLREEYLYTGMLEPSSIAYAVAKLAGMELCFALNRELQRTAFVPVIPATVYGPHDNFDPATGHVVGALIHRFHEAKRKAAERIVLRGSGEVRRECLFADDLAAACVDLLDAELAPARPVNVGVGYDISVADLARTVAKVVGYHGEIVWDATQADGATRKLLDTRMVSALGWRARVSLEDGLRTTYAWYARTKHIDTDQSKGARC